MVDAIDRAQASEAIRAIRRSVGSALRHKVVDAIDRRTARTCRTCAGIGVGEEVVDAIDRAVTRAMAAGCVATSTLAPSVFKDGAGKVVAAGRDIRSCPERSEVFSSHSATWLRASRGATANARLVSPHGLPLN